MRRFKAYAVIAARMSLPVLLAAAFTFLSFGRDKTDFYLCIGQSNMAGRAFADSAAMTNGIPGVMLLNDSGRFEPARHPLNRYSTVRKKIKLQRIGPSGAFGSELVRLTGHTVGLVVNARGETSIRHWQKGATEGYFGEAVARVRQAEKAGGVLCGIIWHQGEYDCTGDTAEYKRQLIRFVNDLRNELGDVPFVAGEISRWNWTETPEGTVPFNRMISSIADWLPNSACVSSEGLTPNLDETDPHFNASSQHELGRRYARAMHRLKLHLHAKHLEDNLMRDASHL